MRTTTGTLIKWLSSHRAYEANGDTLVGLDPVYKYGIIMKVSQVDSSYWAVASCDDGRWHIVNVHEDDYEILSEISGG
jgi:hypothetical protein